MHVITFDVREILEVYDNGTPEKHDDVLVLIRYYWTRFNVTPE
jgi:hypothetical protein